MSSLQFLLCIADELRKCENGLYLDSVFAGDLQYTDGITLPTCSCLYTGWPKKVSHYRESSLSRIKNRQPG